ncbi:hypothetical protein BDZ89DRAFT_1081344 [Hymenopellis radicata]|nr:hypothetical protein BDZ89DRAFT_1086008 [Hymenopellis radicata]KAF9002398.1 hypothetical protein BDZ89DRAFT_1081344 [Hymenopellis radicata]
MPRFTFRADEIPFKREEKYVGVVLNSTLHNIFANHYKKKATAAQSSAHGGLFGLEHHVGRGNIPIRTSLQLYTALVDCHLIHGADVCPDVDSTTLRQLEAVQASTLRRILGLGTRSSKTVLFTELGVFPLRTRRLILCLSYLQYLLDLPPTHLAHLALEVSEDLYNARHSSWMGDLDAMVSSYSSPSTPVHALPLIDSLSRDTIDFIIRSIKRSQRATHDEKINASTSLYLLHGRLEPQDDGPPKQITACLRHYLNQVTIPDHRFAMTRILLGANNLHGVHSETSTAPIALQQCRMCHVHLETPEHMLLQCVADDETIVIRNEFKQRLADITHRRFSPAVFTDGAALFWLRSVLFDWNAAPVVARWIYHTTRRWKALSLLPCEVSAEISWNSERDNEREHI